MDRLDKIYEHMQNLKAEGCDFFFDDSRYDLMTEPGFAQMSFMKRKARMVEATLERVKVRVFPEELIVGTFLGTWIRTNYTSLEERRAFADMNHAFPRRNNRYVNGQEIYYSKPLCLTEEELENPDCVNWSWGHSCGGFKRILEMGYEGIAEEAERKIAEHKAVIQEQIEQKQAELETAPVQDMAGKIMELEQIRKEAAEKIEFWEAVITTTRAVCRLSERYADELERQASAMQSAERAREFRTIAALMRRVPACPAQTFREAVQSVWFSYMCCVKFNGTDLGRLDQYLYPYYRRDVEAGILTKEEAEELIGNFFLKCHEFYIAVPNNAGLHPSIMLGGLNADGKDGTNDITYMCMRATERFETPNPKISVRINDQTPDEVFEIAHRMLLAGVNQPDFYSDDVVLPAYQRLGIPFEDAVEYAQSVCEELSLAGISEDCTNEGPHCDMHDKVKLAMERVSAGEKAETFEAFVGMVEEEIRKCIDDERKFHEIQTEKLRRFSPQPLHSAGIVGCLESGKDITAGGAKYNNTGSVVGGLASAADGLYAIRKLVYEEQRLTMAEFYQILLDDYEGNELLRMEILNKFPKFGNDDERVDQIAAHLFDVYADELEKYPNSRGGIYKIGAWASEYRSSYMATPDGRRRGDTFAVNISPTPGRDIKGVTAVMRSGTKINMKICTAGAMLDVAMNPGCIRGEHGVQILKQLIKAYGQLGGAGLQFNVIDAEVLRAAQEDPMKYRNLMVRVWGYNDYFVSLEKRKQEHVISRTIHGGL